MSRAQFKICRWLLRAIIFASGFGFTLILSPAVVADDRAWQTLSQLEFPKDTPVAFSEARKTRLQRQAKIQTGKLWLAEGDVLVMSIQEPRSELRKITATELSLERGGKTRSIPLDPARGAHQLPLIMVDILNGNTKRLQSNFRVVPANDTATSNSTEPKQAQTARWSWRLVPCASELEKQLTALTLSGEGHRLLAMRTERKSSYQEINILTDTHISTDTSLLKQLESK